MIIYLNGGMVESKELIFSPISSGAAHGYGVFETIKVIGGTTVFLSEHFSRLQKACAVAGISFDAEYSDIRRNSKEVIRLNGIENGLLKVACFKESEGNADIVISAGTKTYDNAMYERGYKLCYAKTPRNEKSALTYIKSTNYMENMMQLKRAHETGYDEPVFLNSKGILSEGAISNVFFVRGCKVFTPSVKCGLLEGIARGKVLSACGQLGIEAVQGVYSKNFYRSADEIFITNSLMGVMPACLFEGKKLSVDSYDITWQLHRMLNKMENLNVYAEQLKAGIK